MLKCLSAVLLCGVAVHGGQALVAREESSVGTTAVAARIEVMREELLRGDDAAAEASVARMRAPVTAEACAAIAGDFMRIAFRARDEGDDRLVERSSGVAIRYLERAERMAADDEGLLAAIHELRGVIQERLIGDSNQATKSYEKALVVNPRSESARHKLRGTGVVGRGE